MFHGNDEDIGVNFKLKAQNGYGNYIFGDAMYTLKIKNGKEDIFHYVNFN
jgi:hypothetical protein